MRWDSDADAQAVARALREHKAVDFGVQVPGGGSLDVYLACPRHRLGNSLLLTRHEHYYAGLMGETHTWITIGKAPPTNCLDKRGLYPSELTDAVSRFIGRVMHHYANGTAASSTESDIPAELQLHIPA